MMVRRTILSVVCLVLYFGVASGQNMTDLAVMNDKTADGRMVQSEVSTVDASVFMHPDRIRFDHRCIQIDGKDTFVLSGTFHYFRTPQLLWRDRLQRLKDGGFNCVETYVPWNWHEREMPASVEDTSKLNLQELDDFLSLAEEMDLYVIVRPGPYICAEWSGGGFPLWLMRKKPTLPKYEVWLQSNDKIFMLWNEHWYRAVCRVVKPHQLFNRAKGRGGVILFQIENEFNRIKWFPREAKKDYLVQLASIARKYGIEVPLITCWTSEARNVEKGPLNGVVDMVNSYPRWQIEKNFGRLINQQLKTQPGKPLISGELQGGWYSDIAGKLSKDQDGVEAVQTQNILLYALQRGFCAVNFYMAVGGTNFNDWAARGVTTTYDYAAAIGEDGSTNERYERIKVLAPFLRQHGAVIAKAKEMYPSYTSSDTTVHLCLRKTAEGDCYYFIRTEEHTQRHQGTLNTAGMTIDFDLEPFGSMVYYVRHGENKGEWFPKMINNTAQDKGPNYVKLHLINCFTDQTPKTWKHLKQGETIDQQGIYSHHPVYYHTTVAAGSELAIGCIGQGVVNGTDADEVIVSVDGEQLPIVSENEAEVKFLVPGNPQSEKQKEVLILFVSKGLHHHTNATVEKYWNIGPTYVRCDGRDLPLSYALTEPSDGEQYSTGNMLPTESGNGLLHWSVYTFDTPAILPCHFKMESLVDGFLYLNGHPLGRSWAKGPQTDFYLPECWLNKYGKNILAISLITNDGKMHFERKR